MPDLHAERKTIKELFQNRATDFLIPKYQRKYEWCEDECQTLWDDIFNFAIPESDAFKFDPDSEYFLGTLVTFRHDGGPDHGKMEVIDGQQRLTTLMLLLRAFYNHFSHMKDAQSTDIRRDIEKCIWKTRDIGIPIRDQLKIDSRVITDAEKSEFLEILRTGNVDREHQSRYAKNFRFFQKNIESFRNEFPMYFAYLPFRIMENCVLLPIEANAQDTALRIFSTLNDRGKPLSDTDIFKAQLYEFYSDKGKEKEKEFEESWKSIDERCQRIFHTGNPMDELFTRYMYFARADRGIKDSTIAMRKFYEKNGYELLRNEETFNNLIVLSQFWENVYLQKDLFSINALKKLFVLNYAPNGMWTYIVSVYFMRNKDQNGLLNDEEFCRFLDKITAFIWAYAVTNPGVSALKTPIFAEMVNIAADKPATFSNFKFDEEKVRNMLDNFTFSNSRVLTKSMAAWWAFRDEEQELPPLEPAFELEHIYPRNRQQLERGLSDEHVLEMLGNKVLLEKRINIRAADYRFQDKRRYYLGYTNARKQEVKGTKIHELIRLAKELDDFTESNICKRNKEIMDEFIKFLRENDLIVEKVTK